MKVSLIIYIFWLFLVFQRWTHYSFSSWKWVWRLFRGLKLWIHDSPTKCKTTIFVFHSPPTQHQRLWVTLALILTNYSQSSISGMVVHFSLRSGFLCINKWVCNQISPVWLQGQGRIGFIHCQSPLWGGVGGGMGWSTPVLLCGSFVCVPPSPLFFLLSWSSPIAFSPVVKWASTGSRLLLKLMPSWQ